MSSEGNRPNSEEPEYDPCSPAIFPKELEEKEYQPSSPTHAPPGADEEEKTMVYQDLLNASFFEETDITPEQNQDFTVRDFSTPSNQNVIHYRIQSQESFTGNPSGPQKGTTYRIPLINQHGERKLPRPCKYYAQGNCQFGYNCRFFHAPDQKDPSLPSSLPRKRNNKCQIKECQAFAKIDICQECCRQNNFCENRPCPNLRTNDGPEPTLCASCYEKENTMPRRVCRSQGCLNNCLSFYTHCRDCFVHSKLKKCFTRNCVNSLLNPTHKYCKACHLKRNQNGSRFHPYSRINTGTKSKSPTSSWISSFLQRE